jgi:hypothetical protein
LSIAAEEQTGRPLADDEALELADPLLLLLLENRQEALFSQPQPSPLLIAADVQVGREEPDWLLLWLLLWLLPLWLPDCPDWTMQERPFSKPQLPLMSAVGEHGGCLSEILHDRLFS